MFAYSLFTIKSTQEIKYKEKLNSCVNPTTNETVDVTYDLEVWMSSVHFQFIRII